MKLQRKQWKLDLPLSKPFFHNLWKKLLSGSQIQFRGRICPLPLSNIVYKELMNRRFSTLLRQVPWCSCLMSRNLNLLFELSGTTTIFRYPGWKDPVIVYNIILNSISSSLDWNLLCLSKKLSEIQDRKWLAYKVYCDPLKGHPCRVYQNTIFNSSKFWWQWQIQVHSYRKFNPGTISIFV